ncbi:MAG: hypothetical protein ACJ74I_15410 [Gaiellaceae bacterium]
MFTPRELALERGWPGMIQGDLVIQFAAQTLEAFFSGGGKAREHNVYPLSGIALRPPVLRPHSIRFFEDESAFSFGNTASIFGPEDEVPAPAPAESRFCVAAVVGGEEKIAGFTLVNDWRAPSLDPPKDRDFATSIGPWVETDYAPEFDFERAREVAARNTLLRAGDLLVAPPFAIGTDAATVEGLGSLLTSSAG